ncbi:hypothetical protein V8C42DRAFT_323860 [Trichoderma barbatum]
MKHHILLGESERGSSLPKDGEEINIGERRSGFSSFLYILPFIILFFFFSVSVGTAATFVSHGVLGMIHLFWISWGNIRSHVPRWC